jgi:hypothetical protein
MRTHELSETGRTKCDHVRLCLRALHPLSTNHDGGHEVYSVEILARESQVLCASGERHRLVWSGRGETIERREYRPSHCGQYWRLSTINFCFLPPLFSLLWSGFDHSSSILMWSNDGFCISIHGVGLMTQLWWAKSHKPYRPITWSHPTCNHNSWH